MQRSLTLWHPGGFGNFWKEKPPKHKHENISAPVQGYRPGRHVKRRGTSSSLHSIKKFCLGVAFFLWVTS